MFSCLLVVLINCSPAIVYSINDNESCAEVLLDTVGDEIVNVVDSRGRYVILYFLDKKLFRAKCTKCVRDSYA